MRIAHISPIAALAACSFAASNVPVDSDGTTTDSSERDAATADGAIDGRLDAAPDAMLDARPDAMVDAAPTLLTWQQDTQADFGPGVTSNSLATSWNTVEPRAHAPGWLTRGKAGSLFDDENALDFASLAGETDRILATTIGASNSLQAPKWISGVNDAFTQWSTGEIFLDAGLHVFRAACDDRAVFAVDLGAGFTKVVSCNFGNGAQTGQLNVPTAGWYAIQLAWTDALGFAKLGLDHRKPNGTNFVAITAAEMRTDVTAETNPQQLGFDQIGLTNFTGSHLWQSDVLAANFGTSAPANVGISQATRWASRWVGQVRLEAAGMYSFALVSNGGHRVLLNGEHLADTALAAPAMTTTAPRYLNAGWHDFAVDLNVDTPTNAAPGGIALTVAAGGPEFAGQTLPNARFRPVTTGVERIVSNQDTANVNVARNTTVIRNLAITGIPADAVVTGVDLAYRAAPANGQTLSVSLRDPNGMAVSVGSGGNQPVTLALADFNTRLASGTWQLSITSTGGANQNAQSNLFALTVHYKTLAQPSIATNATYESVQHDFGTPVTLTSVAWLERQAGSNGIALAVRACAQACTNQPYVAVPSNGGVPAGQVGQFVQYRATFTSNGITVPALDKVTIIGAH